MSTGGAHPSLTTLETGRTRSEIARIYSEEHAQIWDLVRRCAAAEREAPPVFDVVALRGQTAKLTLESLGLDILEHGWLEHLPSEQGNLRAKVAHAAQLLTNAAQGTIEIEHIDVLATPPSDSGPTVADLLHDMRDRKIGRPATFARHIENVFAMVDDGYLTLVNDRSFALEPTGMSVLECLEDATFPKVGIEHCAELEHDLEEIETGRVDAPSILRKHLGRVVDLEKAQASPAPQQRSAFLDNDTSQETPGLGYLPPTIDPAQTLPPNHALRHVKTTIETFFRERDRTLGTKRDASRQKAIAVAASAKLWHLKEHDELLERLQFDLALRWICGLHVHDVVWSCTVFAALLEGRSDDIAQLQSSIAQSRRIHVKPTPQ